MISILKVNTRFFVCLALSATVHIVAVAVLYSRFAADRVTSQSLGNEMVEIEAAGSARKQIQGDGPSTGANGVRVPASTGKTKSNDRIHVVTPGESYWVVAKKYGMSIDELLEANGLTVDDVLRVGQKLKVKSVD